MLPAHAVCSERLAFTLSLPESCPPQGPHAALQRASRPARLTSGSRGVPAVCPCDYQEELEKESVSGDRTPETFLCGSPARCQSCRGSLSSSGDVLGQASWACGPLRETFWWFLWCCGGTEVGSAGFECGDTRLGEGCPLGSHGAVQSFMGHFALWLSSTAK